MAEGWSPFGVNESSLTHEDIDLEAEDDEIDIIPSFNLPKQELIGGEYGPFRPQMRSRAPLWLAILLRRRNKCRIVAPDWMTPTKLDELIQREQDAGPKAFASLPRHYIEIGTQILKHSGDDIDVVDEVGQKLERLRGMRFHKLQAGLKRFESDLVRSQVPRLDNLSPMEISLIRPLFSASLDAFFTHAPS